jgi:hypothetical protein
MRALLRPRSAVPLLAAGRRAFQRLICAQEILSHALRTDLAHRLRQDASKYLEMASQLRTEAGGEIDLGMLQVSGPTP